VVVDTLRAVTAGMKTMKHRMQAAYAKDLNQLPGPENRRDKLSLLSLLINEVSVNELKYKVCIFEMKCLKKKLDSKHDIDNVFCFHETCSYSFLLKLHIITISLYLFSL